MKSSYAVWIFFHSVRKSEYGESSSIACKSLAEAKRVAKHQASVSTTIVSRIEVVRHKGTEAIVADTIWPYGEDHV